MKYNLEIDKDKRAVRFTKLLCKDATYLLDSYYCKDNQKWYLVHRKNMLPEIVTVIVASIGMLAVILAAMLICGLLLPGHREFYGISASWPTSVFTFLAIYRWLPTIWLSKVIGIEAEECDETQAVAQHERYLAAVKELESKKQVNREIAILMIASMFFVIIFALAILLFILKSQGRL